MENIDSILGCDTYVKNIRLLFYLIFLISVKTINKYEYNSEFIIIFEKSKQYVVFFVEFVFVVMIDGKY